MRKLCIKEEWIQRALSRDFGSLANSITEGKGNLPGLIGEEAVAAGDASTSEKAEADAGSK